MSDIKRKLYNFRNTLSIEQEDVSKIITAHQERCDSFSEREIYASLAQSLENFKFFENVNNFLSDFESELSSDPLRYKMKDLRQKLKRKNGQFLYEHALLVIDECIKEGNTDDDIKYIANTKLKMYDWEPLIKEFLFTITATPQEKSNLTSRGGKISDVYSPCITVESGVLAYIHDTWFLFGENFVEAVELDKHIKDVNTVYKLRILQDVCKIATFTEDSITLPIAEKMEMTITESGYAVNGEALDKDTTIESYFQTVVPMEGKKFYTAVVETKNMLNKFCKIDTVKKVENVIYENVLSYIFNYKESVYQYKVDKQRIQMFKYKTCLPVVEQVMQELGVDVSFFYENLLDVNVKAKKKLEEQEKQISYKIQMIDESILEIKIQDDSVKLHEDVQKVYNQLLVQKFKLNEQLKLVRNEKHKLITNV